MADQDDLTMDTHSIGGTGFQFSGASIDDLGASEYTEATIAVDISGSTSGYLAAMGTCVSRAVAALRKSPRADNLLLRVITFDHRLTEVHGFKPLPKCNEADYVNALHAGGSTALHDAVYEAVMSTITYAKTLAAHDYTLNGILIVITDGQDNASTTSAKMVKDALAAAIQSEALESMNTILVGVGVTAGGLDHYLDTFQREAGFQQYVGMPTVDDASMARLCGFMSGSVSSSSQALNTGGPSKSLSF